MIATGALAITAASLAAALVAQGPHAASGRRASGATTTSARTASAGSSSSTGAAKRSSARAKSDDSPSAAAAADTPVEKTDDKAEGGKSAKTRTYTFGAMDVEGKMKTPQLLYFLNRVKLELEMSAPDKKSFMKELEHSADDSSL